MITEPGSAPTLSVSIVLHNSSLRHLRVTLRSLLESLPRLEGLVSAPVSLTILDNCSEPAYQQALSGLLAELKLAQVFGLTLSVVHSCENGGFGSGHNRVLKDRSERYLLILNPDVELDREALREAVVCLESNVEVVAVNPYCQRSDGSREYLCKRYPTMVDLLLRGLPFAGLRRVFHRRLARYEYHDIDPRAAANVELLSGACLMCRQSDFAAVESFDERFFMYFEDFDLSKRLSPRGQLLFLPSMKIVHHGGFAATKGLRHIAWFTRSALRFFTIHGWRLH